MIGQIRKGLNAKRRGFTLIELAIVLAVASVLFAGLWRLMASGNTQLRDQSAADQHRQIVDGVKSYFQTTAGQTWLSTHATGAAFAVPLPAVAGNCAPIAGLCDYLPAGFSTATTNSYGQTYSVGAMITKDATTGALLTYSFMVETLGGDAIPDTSGGRIASMIGSDGGFVYSTTVCTANWACGAYGAWQLNPTTYALAAPGGGHIASRSYSGLNASSLQPWLARVTVPNGATIGVVGGTAPDFNTIQQNTYLGLVPGAPAPSYATIYGAAAGYGGMISNLRFLRIGRPAADNTSLDAVLEINSGCKRTSIADAACSNNVYITGGVAIAGLLTSDILYAGQFIYNSSDIRLKEDIKPLDKVLDKFAQIKGYSFKMKNTKEKKYGVIAQEVEKVFPDIVHVQSGGEYKDQYKAVDYMGLVGPLVAAVNELKLQNDALKAQIDKQQQTIEALSAQGVKKAK